MYIGTLYTNAVVLFYNSLQSPLRVNCWKLPPPPFWKTRGRIC